MKIDMNRVELLNLKVKRFVTSIFWTVQWGESEGGGIFEAYGE